MPQQLDWKAEYAYTAGMQAFIYGFPYIYNAKLRHDWVTQARNPAVVPYAAVNHFWHAARVMDATYRDGGLRMYRPHPAVIQAKWECPGITPVT